MKRILLLLFIVSCHLSYSQAPQSWTSAEMYQAIRKLNVLGSVLYIAAHPDDENTRLIAYLSKDKLYRTGYLSMTRGDGGQNLIGDEQGIELGLIRTQELLAARRIDGGEQFFTRAYDFGYSKTPEETFRIWDKEKILADVVWVIRKYQPDVIIARFPTTGEGGHGHHTASAILANEAFAAAADPKRFPEQLQYVSPWQVKRLLWNSFAGQNVNREDQLKIDVGGYNPLLGKSYGEIAAESRSQHKSQGFGVPAGRGEALEYFKATQGSQPSTELLEGVDMGWSRIGASQIEAMVDAIASSFDFLKPEKSVKGLTQLYKAIESLPAGNWRNKKLAETLELIQQCSGLFIDATAADPFAVQSDSIRTNFLLNNRLGVAAKLMKVSLVGEFDTTLNQTLTRNRNISFGKTIYVRPQLPVTQPYWLQAEKAEGYYNVKSLTQIGEPDIQPSYLAQFVIDVEGTELTIPRRLKYRFTDPVRGEVYSPVTIMPSYSMHVIPDLIIADSKGYGYDLSVTSYKANNIIKAEEKKNLNGTDGTESAATMVDFPLNKETHTVSMRVNPPKSSSQVSSKTDSLFYINSLTQAPVYDVFRINHDHIPSLVYFKPASLVVKKFQYETYGKKIAYIPGAGDKVIEALEQMGYDVNRITEKELSKNDLDKFDAIITGVRAYNTNEWLNKHYDKLMKYVEKGGNLIVQYNTSNQIGPVRAKISPYKFDISRARVTDENAVVTILKPEHPVFNFPNKITQEDFRGWIQERSIYHAAQWDSTKFETVMAMNDPGEKPDEGALIIAKYGKGVFTYTGLVFFRELPAGVTGAYRLLANLIALNRKKGF